MLVYHDDSKDYIILKISTDVDWVGEKKTNKLTLWYLVLLNSTIISQLSKYQIFVV